MDRNGNDNCLEGIECPKCGEHDEIQVVATSVFSLLDNGTDHHTDVEYDSDAFVYCTNSECGHEGKLADFTFAEG